ncbi:MAG: FAD-dependent monooxygenase [Streptococcaceae bacterium]|jgi:2-polyprenyl-6-methoxyphenol hydroxylase-like FAD-dependent oxidoreductase|nr:FAD-dependent monooxygenase [Streptococcaceae bacterium]
MENKETDICIVGAGPAGLLVAKLLLDKGYKVILLDKQKDFNKEFRGEYIQPGVVNILKQLNMFESLEPYSITITNYRILDHGKVVFKYDFDGNYGICIRQSLVLPLMLKECEKHDQFSSCLGQTAFELIKKDDKVVGIKTKGDYGDFDIRAKLVIGSDGRNSIINKLLHVPINKKQFLTDILWINIECPKNFGNKIDIRIYDEGYVVLDPAFPNQIRMGISIKKGGIGELRKKYPDIKEFTAHIVKVVPEAQAEIISAVTAWSSFTPLSVSGMVSEKWSADGVVLIGDAAHTVGPFGGQGINQAMKDAIILARIISQSSHSEFAEDKILDQLRELRYSEVASVHEFQLAQGRLLEMKGLLGRVIRRIIYHRITRNRKSGNNILSKLTFKDLTL